MVAPNLCYQCKSHTSSVHSTPCESLKSIPTSYAVEGKGNNNNDKPIYVKTKASDDICIVVEKGEGKCKGNISFQIPCKLDLVCSGGGSSPNCIKIIGNSKIIPCNGGLQIIPCKKKGGSGNMQISLAGGHPVLQLGGSSARQCGSNGCTFQAFFRIIVMYSNFYFLIFY